MAEVTKQEILQIIEHLPDDITLTDALYELFVRAEIEAGMKEARQGRTVSSEDVLRSVDEWLRSAGH